jgi:hypothetical protein
MIPQAHRYGFNMELCRACEEKRVYHTITAVELQTETKSAAKTQTIL